MFERRFKNKVVVSEYKYDEDFYIEFMGKIQEEYERIIKDNEDNSGSGKVTAQFTNLTAANVREGVNIGGIIGTLKAIQSPEGPFKIKTGIIETGSNQWTYTTVTTSGQIICALGWETS